MNLQQTLRELFEPILEEHVTETDERLRYLSMIKPTQSAEHGDYQANFAMPLAKKLGRKPHDIANEIMAKVSEA